MRTLRYSVIVGAVAILSLATVSLVSNSAAQNQPPAKTPWKCIGCSPDGKTTPRAPDGHPDLSGYWGPGTQGVAGHLSSRSADGSVLFDFGGASRAAAAPTGANGALLQVPAPNANGLPPEFPGLTAPSYKPEYMAKVKESVANEYNSTTAEDPLFECRPLGVPRIGGGYNSGNAMQIVQTPDTVVVLYEDEPGPVFRIIYTDGRPHPDDLEPSDLGDTIGHWDGDALVTDVLGLADSTWLGGGLHGPRYARFHSDEEHVIERWTRKGDDLTYEATVEDPVMFTKPWVITPRVHKHAGPDDRSYIFENTCVPNDEGHIIRPIKEDPGGCNYCVGAARTAGTGLAPKKKPN